MVKDAKGIQKRNRKTWFGVFTQLNSTWCGQDLWIILDSISCHFLRWSGHCWHFYPTCEGYPKNLSFRGYNPMPSPWYLLGWSVESHATMGENQMLPPDVLPFAVSFVMGPKESAMFRWFHCLSLDENWSWFSERFSLNWPPEMVWHLNPPFERPGWIMNGWWFSWNMNGWRLSIGKFQASLTNSQKSFSEG